MAFLTQFVLFILLIIGLNFFRSHIAHSLQKISYLFFNSPVPGVIFYSIFFLVGVVIHELSHLLTAEILGVRTGAIKIFPEEIKSGSLRMGSVQTVSADPFREAIIGAAPFLVGITLTTAIVSSQFGFLYNFRLDRWPDFITPINILLLYLVFSIANTMYVSKEDQRAWWILPIMFTLAGSMIYVFNLKFTEFLPILLKYLKVINFALIFCLALDLIFSLAVFLTKKAGEQITGRRIFNSDRIS